MRTISSARPVSAERLGTGFGVGRSARLSRNGLGIVVDGAVGYSLRLIPSNKIIGRFETTHDAWPAVIEAVDTGRLPRLLVLDWHGSDESSGRVASGRSLEYLARAGLGLPAEHLRRRR